MILNDQLNKILAFATRAHEGQKRKFADEPYIVHPMRVMDLCRTQTEDVAILGAALMHDVLEDCEVSEAEMDNFLRQTLDAGSAAHCLRLVVDLTDIYTHAAYPSMNRRMRKEKEAARLSKAHPDAQTVKYADIIDNTNDIVGSGDDFAPRFLKECKALLKGMPNGNPVLYAMAIEKVNEALKKV